MNFDLGFLMMFEPSAKI